MNIRELQAFIHLSSSLHFSQSADAIHVSPSTLSRMMQRLEEEFGQRFFERDNRSVKLTRAGIRFIDFAHRVIQEWEGLRQDFNVEEHTLTGELTIYCTVTAAHLYLAELVDRYRQLYPQVTMNIETGDVSMAYQKVSDESVDIAFAVASDKMPKKYHFQPIELIPLQVVGPIVNTSFSQYIKPNSVDWQQVPFILPESGPAKKRTEEWLQAMGIKPKVYAHVSGHEAIVSMVALGCGIALVPSPVLEHSPVVDKIKRLPVSVNPKPFDFGVICLQKRRNSPVISSFMEIVSQRYA